MFEKTFLEMETIKIGILSMRSLKSTPRNFSGIAARIIQHEYDHIEGVLFTDKLTPLKKNGCLKENFQTYPKGKIRYRL